MKNPQAEGLGIAFNQLGNYFFAGAAAGAGATAAVAGGTNGGGATQGAGSGVPAFLYFIATALIDWQS
jgi:hypothetical protein